MNTCLAEPTKLKNWEPARTEDWMYFITSYRNNTPTSTATNLPYPLPTALVQYLKQNPAILSQYHGHNIETCTTERTSGMLAPNPRPSKVPGQPQPEFPQPPAAPPFPPSLPSISTNTFLQTTYESTSTHVTVAGCLRCQNTKPPPAATPNVQSFSEQGHNAAPEPTQDVNQHGQTKPNTPQQGDGQGGPNAGDGNSNGGNANGGNSNGGNSNGGNSNGGNSNDGSSNGNNSNDQRPPGNPVVIGGSTFTVRPGQSTPAPDRPGNQNQPPPVVVIGSQTLTQGQSTIINGVPVVVPSDAGGSQVVIGGTSYPVNNGPTAAPVLTVGQSTVTANPEGQFIVGSETLKPGGPALTIDGSTVSLGPGGGIAIINGATQTLANAPVITSPPAITVDGRIIPATVVGGTTQLVIAGQTLVPGGPAITVDGTTYSLPSGTQLLANGIPLTGQTIGSTSVLDGTTAYILGPSATLTPGAALTLSGTTYSMPPGAPSVIIINGMTSTLARTTPAPALTIAGKTYTPATRAGTLEYVLAQGTTLRPGQAVTLGGTTYSLDPAGTALVANGQTSSVARGPASTSASTTGSRNVGDFIWSGIGGGAGGSTSRAGAEGRTRGVDMWVEGVVVGFAGWLALLV
ncbi:hypothetical protein HBI56_076360 [Parastagonospora nodorum]|uniref:Uncharacterized protein n=1 Tax=Phaeosphaeria nodorum (strain SN15 / ATCC MYA-4574 / FGSC 10173) TaxID=321614 RepID=A0A7U2F099_PHANO|nr:hypothetical protein HBH56_150800 [Parastagonospora nodorum]QRC94295.1 hypothetical protein JI435_075490 [Parastagonospora nodorum SN15]KAH3928631.1 hypothetical protein HBH54_136700 [Parastagonospora nodorum]KAH3985475.1 hypothetical protein HBH51_020520 [Parastagonospora nodorum]KAH4003408.1 hypothetical protein HBI10_059680 [Parastagonospora nodorum]